MEGSKQSKVLLSAVWWLPLGGSRDRLPLKTYILSCSKTLVLLCKYWLIGVQSLALDETQVLKYFNLKYVQDETQKGCFEAK